jgi:hypothetical protein
MIQRRSFMDAQFLSDTAAKLARARRTANLVGLVTLPASCLALYLARESSHEYANVVLYILWAFCIGLAIGVRNHVHVRLSTRSVPDIVSLFILRHEEKTTHHGLEIRTEYKTTYLATDNETFNRELKNFIEYGNSIHIWAIAVVMIFLLAAMARRNGTY